MSYFPGANYQKAQLENARSFFGFSSENQTPEVQFGMINGRYFIGSSGHNVLYHLDNDFFNNLVKIICGAKSLDLDVNATTVPKPLSVRRTALEVLEDNVPNSMNTKVQLNDFPEDRNIVVMYAGTRFPDPFPIMVSQFSHCGSVPSPYPNPSPAGGVRMDQVKVSAPNQPGAPYPGMNQVCTPLDFTRCRVAIVAVYVKVKDEVVGPIFVEVPLDESATERFNFLTYIHPAVEHTIRLERAAMEERFRTFGYTGQPNGQFVPTIEQSGEAINRLGTMRLNDRY